MNPIGYRMEEKKESDPYHHHNHRSAYKANNNNINNPTSPTGSNTLLETKSTHSYKSTQSSRSSVLERAREYNRRIDQQNNPHSKSSSRRSKSLERGETSSQVSRSSERSRSAGRPSQGGSSFLQSAGNQAPSRERAMASVRKDSAGMLKAQATFHQKFDGGGGGAAARRREKAQQQHAILSPEHPAVVQQQQQQQQPLTSPASRSTSTANRSKATATTATTPNNNIHSNSTPNHNRMAEQQRQPQPEQERHRPTRLQQQPQPAAKQQQQDQDPEAANNNAIVTPELLVDALSGHEDGLLAIAEKLMEHYDNGYDVMGEAIIDAFADVQKLFQHVVEAAHMEGAAFEASRRQQELAEQQAEQGGDALPETTPTHNSNKNTTATNTPGGPARHDEFVDQDVKDVLTEAIRQGTKLLQTTNHNNNGPSTPSKQQHQECYHLYEQACQSASALLPVDSDHRGRLQLSIARAESMAADRAVAILRYAMDDVLRSGLRANYTPLPDVSKRADVVLSVSKTVVTQSPDEALASLTAELQEIMDAPVYHDTPLQSVATRFWAALQESQKTQSKREEKLEQALAKLKGDYLLARAEWEEKLNTLQDKADLFKGKYDKLKEQHHDTEAKRRHARSGSSGGGDDYMDQARSTFAQQNGSNNANNTSTSSSFLQEASNSFRSQHSGAGRPPSVASMSSGIALHAKKLVNSINDFNCNNAGTGAVNDDYQDLRQSRSTPKKNKYSASSSNSSQQQHTPSRSQVSSGSRLTTSGSATTPLQQQQQLPSTRSSSRSFREYSKSPKRMDV